MGAGTQQAQDTKTSRTPSKATGRKRATAKKKTTRRGRVPTLVKPDVMKRFLDLVRAGNYLQTAAIASGIGRSTLWSWVQRGRRERERLIATESDGGKVEPLESERVYLDFLDAVERAEAEAEAYHVTNIRALAGPSNDGQVRARASFGYLERKAPERWSRSERHDVHVGGGTESTVTVVVEQEQRERTAAILGVLAEVGVLEHGVGGRPALGSGPNAPDDEEITDAETLDEDG